MPGRILIADSNDASAGRLKAFLEAEYFEVLIVKTSALLHARIIGKHPDCLIIARVFDGQDGTAVCDMVKNEGETSHLPCVMYGGDAIDWARVADCGADDAFCEGDVALIERLRELYRRKDHLDSLRFHLNINSELGFSEPRPLPFNAMPRRVKLCLICDDELKHDSLAALSNLRYEVSFVDTAEEADLCLIGCAGVPQDAHFRTIVGLVRGDVPLLCYQRGDGADLDGLRRAVKLGCQEAFLVGDDLQDLATKCLSLLHFNQTKRSLKKQMRDHFTQASQDPLTGLYNRRYTMNFLERALDRQKTDGKQMVIMALDIDYFKSVNDAFGHSIGDKVLQNLSALMLNNLREADLVARLGGEEFLVVITSNHEKTAQDIAGRLLSAVKSAELLPDGRVMARPITVSIGMTFSNAAETAKRLLSRADNALYHAKENGRDQVQFCSLDGECVRVGGGGASDFVSASVSALVSSSVSVGARGGELTQIAV